MILVVIVQDHTSPLLPFIVIVHPKIFCVGLLAMVSESHLCLQALLIDRSTSGTLGEQRARFLVPTQ
jgi:hypothetical protein